MDGARAAAASLAVRRGQTDRCHMRSAITRRTVQGTQAEQSPRHTICHVCVSACLYTASVCCLVKTCCGWAANSALLILTATTARIHPGRSSVGSCKDAGPRPPRNCSQESSPVWELESPGPRRHACSVPPSSPWQFHAVQKASRVLALPCQPVPYNPLPTAPAQRLRPRPRIPHPSATQHLQPRHHATLPPHLRPETSCFHHSQPNEHHTRASQTRAARQLLPSGPPTVS